MQAKFPGSPPEAIDLLDKAPVDTDNPNGRLFKHIKDNKLDFVKLLALANNYYNKDVVLKLGRIASTGEIAWNFIKMVMLSEHW